MKANLEIREILKQHNIPQWKIAECMKQSEGTFCRKMRHELSDQEKRKVINSIQKLIHSEGRLM